MDHSETPAVPRLGPESIITDAQKAELSARFGACNYALVDAAAELVRQWAIGKCNAYAERKQAQADAAVSLRDKINRPMLEGAAMGGRDLAEEIGGG